MPKLSPAFPQLPTGNIDRTAAFFVEQLGFRVKAKFPTQKFLIVEREDAEIHFWTAETDADAREVGSNSSCYIRVEEIDELYKEFKARGVRFRYELTKQPWGMYEMQIDDPYGNAIRFGEVIS